MEDNGGHFFPFGGHFQPNMEDNWQNNGKMEDIGGQNLGQYLLAFSSNHFATMLQH